MAKKAAKPKKVSFDKGEVVEAKKTIEAAQIVTVKHNSKPRTGFDAKGNKTVSNVGAILGFGPEFETVAVSEKFVKENDPRAGGFYTKDGDYISADEYYSLFPDKKPKEENEEEEGEKEKDNQGEK